MTAPASLPEIKGWCPGALRPMLSGDGWVARIRARGGRLTAAQATGIARLAETCGNGLLDLSQRANLQIRGVREDRLAALTDGLDALGLLDPDPAAEARRNVTVTPFWVEGDGTAELAAALEDALLAATDLALPGKFGFAVDTGPAPVLAATPADIRLERGPAGLILRPDGAATGRPVTEETAVDAALALARWFLASGGAPAGRGRMAAHIARAGLPPGFDTPAGGSPPTPSLPHAGGGSRPANPLSADIGRATPHRASPPPRGEATGGLFPVPGPHPRGSLAALAFGQTDAATLSALATGPIRLTPWRMLLLEGRAAPTLPGIITDPADARLRVIACTGAPGCPQALAPTRPLAAALAATLPAGTVLHVSGCAKGCAHPGPAPLTLTATPQGWRLARDAAPADPGATVAPLHAPPTDLAAHAPQL